MTFYEWVKSPDVFTYKESSCVDVLFGVAVPFIVTLNSEARVPIVEGSAISG